MPVASNEISFRISGAGHLIGLGNGDPSCHEADIPVSASEGKRSAFNGLCMAIMQSTKQAGDILVQALAVGLEPGSFVLHSQASKLRPTAD